MDRTQFNFIIFDKKEVVISEIFGCLGLCFKTRDSFSPSIFLIEEHSFLHLHIHHKRHIDSMALSKVYHVLIEKFVLCFITPFSEFDFKTFWPNRTPPKQKIRRICCTTHTGFKMPGV